MDPKIQQFIDESTQDNNDPFAFLNQEEVTVPVDQVVTDTTDPVDPEPRNRREKRLMDKLQSERESAIALAARLEALSESQKNRSEDAEYLNVAERIYGNSTPELREATELLKTALMGVKDEAKREALQEYQSLRQKEQEAVTIAEKRIDSMLEEIEDDHNVDFTPATRTEFLKLVEKMSPKDSHGNIIEYADHHAVWDIYQEKLNARKQPNPAKEMAARSMTTSNGAKDSALNNDVHERFLREHGII